MLQLFVGHVYNAFFAELPYTLFEQRVEQRDDYEASSGGGSGAAAGSGSSQIRRRNVDSHSLL